MIKLIASDLDGTLLTDHKELSEETKKAMDFAIRKGIVFVPATGRSFASVPSMLREYPGIEYIIASNGGAVYSTRENKRVYQCLMDVKSVEAVLALPRPKSVIVEAFVDGIPYSEPRYLKNPKAFGANDIGSAYVRKTRRVVEDMDAFVRAHKHEMDEMSFVCAVPEEREFFYQGLRTIPQIFITSSMDHLLEIGHVDAGKGKTLARLLQLLGISPEEAMAFGDADNDCDMLTAVKYGIAMKNASETCKKAAYAVTDSNEKDGVAKAIWKFVGENKE